jgi:threonylcarbamoyladenosine tRNA methylthiotransferase MtaB
LDAKTYRVSTLGCRVNKADSLAIEKQLSAEGFMRALEGEIPDLWVVNTCAVTGEGMRKSRKLVRRCARSGASVVVTGCGVEMDADAFHVDGVGAVVPNSMKPFVLEKESGPGKPLAGTTTPNRWFPQDLVRVPVKVQDGCGRYCTYCVVPYLRPEPFSRSIASVLEEVCMLREAGAGEVILCGIDLGSYRDPESGGRIDSLVEAVTARAGDIWVRLSSIELSDVSDRLVELLDAKAICRHLHIPLQSGDAGVLHDMGREYGPKWFAEKIGTIREAVGEISVTTDVMVGFPTENEEAFLATRALLESIGFSRVHVFKSSSRPIAKASALGDPVDSATKNRRASDLRKLASSSALRFQESLVGRIIPVLVEAVMDGVGGRRGLLFARTESFSGIAIEGDADLVGSVVKVRVTSAGPGGLKGRIIEGPAAEPRGR